MLSKHGSVHLSIMTRPTQPQWRYLHKLRKCLCYCTNSSFWRKQHSKTSGIRDRWFFL